jgi:hypothetical protein
VICQLDDLTAVELNGGHYYSRVLLQTRILMPSVLPDHSFADRLIPVHNAVGQMSLAAATLMEKLGQSG